MDHRSCFGVTILFLGLWQLSFPSVSADESVSGQDMEQLLDHMGLSQGSTLVIFREHDFNRTTLRAMDNWALEHGVMTMVFHVRLMENVLLNLMEVVMETRKLEKYYSSLNFVVACDNCLTDIIPKLSLMDEEFGKGSLLRHYSKWLFIHKNGEKLKPVSTVLDNVAVVYKLHHNSSAEYLTSASSSLTRSNFTKTEYCLLDIFTLMWRTDGRQWSRIRVESQSNSSFQINCPIFPNADKGLNGRKLKALFLEWASYCKKVPEGNSTFTYVSSCREVMQYFARALNFTYDMVEPPDRKWGAPVTNTTWNGLLGMLVRNDADVTTLPYGITPTRSAVLSYSTGLWTPPYQVSYLRQFSDRSSWTSLIACFKWEVYVCGGCVLLCVVLLLAIVEHRPRRLKRRRRNSVLPVCCVGDTYDIATNVIAVPFHQGSVYQPSTTPGKLLHVSWWFFCIIITAVYTGNLIAFLTVEKERIPFSTLEELAADKEFKLLIPRNSYIESIMSTSNVSIMKSLWRKIQLSRTVDFSTTQDEYDHKMKLLRSGEAAVIEVTDTLEYFDSLVPNLRRMKQTVSSIAMCLPFPKYSPLEPLFSREVLILHDNGMIEGMRRNWDMKKTQPEEDNKGTQLLEISDLKSVLVACGVGIFLSLVALSVEHCIRAIHCKQKDDQEH